VLLYFLLLFVFFVDIEVSQDREEEDVDHDNDNETGAHDEKGKNKTCIACTSFPIQFFLAIKGQIPKVQNTGKVNY